MFFFETQCSNTSAVHITTTKNNTKLQASVIQLNFFSK